jgi:integrase
VGCFVRFVLWRVVPARRFGQLARPGAARRGWAFWINVQVCALSRRRSPHRRQHFFQTARPRLPRGRVFLPWSLATVREGRGGHRPYRVGQGQPVGQRDATMILTAYRHRLRASESVDLRWDQIDFDAATLAVRRAKKGNPSTHPIRGDELRALRKLQREQEPRSPFVFTSERGAPFTPAGFARKIEHAGEAGGLGFKAHPHILRHACGFALANAGHDTRSLQAYLGHRNIQHTVHYTELSPDRFKDVWRR